VAIKSNIFIDQGTDVEFTYNLKNDDGSVLILTGYTATSQLRKHYSSSNAYSFTTVIDEGNGLVTISMNSSATANITAGRYVYDCEVTSNTGTISRIVEGIATIRPQVTRI